jgi:hypothetical protein
MKFVTIRGHHILTRSAICRLCHSGRDRQQMAYELTFIESYLVAAFIAAVVSLDVAGLLISQNGEFKGDLGLRWTGKALVHSFLHATFHAVLFYVYFVGLNFAMFLPDWLTSTLIDILRCIDIDIAFDGPSARSAILFMFSTLIVVFVWITYSNKIVENHANKVSKDNNYIASARIDVRFIYFLISILQFLVGKFIVFVQRVILRKIYWSPSEWPQWLIQVCLCLAVAVDMLAVASFIRVWFKDASDPGNETSTGGSELVHFNFGNSALSDHQIFAVVIFLGVFLISFFVIKESGGLHEERAKKCLRRFRRIEPWLVFSLLLIALDHLFGNRLTGMNEFWLKVIVCSVFGYALMWLLVLFHGKDKVDAMVDEGYNVLSSHNLSSTTPFRDSQFALDLAKFLGWALIALILLVVGTFASFGGDASSFSPLANLLFWTGTIATIGSLFLLFAPAKWLIARYASDLESRVDTWIATVLLDGKLFLRKSLYISAVCLLILFYMHLSFLNLAIGSIFTSPDDESFLAPLAFLILSYWIVFILVERRSTRGGNFSQLRVLKGQAKLVPNFGDVLTALSLVVFSIAICMSLVDKFS